MELKPCLESFLEAANKQDGAQEQNLRLTLYKKVLEMYTGS